MSSCCILKHFLDTLSSMLFNLCIVLNDDNTYPLQRIDFKFFVKNVPLNCFCSLGTLHDCGLGLQKRN